MPSCACTRRSPCVGSPTPARLAPRTCGGAYLPGPKWAGCGDGGSPERPAGLRAAASWAQPRPGAPVTRAPAPTAVAPEPSPPAGVTAARAPPFLLGTEARRAEGSGHAHCVRPASGGRCLGDRGPAAGAPPPRRRPADLAAPQGQGAAARTSARCGPADEGRASTHGPRSRPGACGS